MVGVNAVAGGGRERNGRPSARAARLRAALIHRAKFSSVDRQDLDNDLSTEPRYHRTLGRVTQDHRKIHLPRDTLRP
jgi:hypothetical protein